MTPPPVQPSTQPDAVIVGAGVIGCSIALQLAKRGIQPLVIDKLPGAGYGSTSSSSAIVRFSYSTEAGVAMAYESLKWWLDWPNVLAPAQPDHLVEFINYPMLTLNFDGGSANRAIPFYEKFDIPFEVLDVDELMELYPMLDLHRFGPPAGVDDDAFWRDPDTMLFGSTSTPESGYISDPMLSAQNLQDAAVAHGAEFMFNTEIAGVESSESGVAGVRLVDGTVVAAPIVINAAGPYSSTVNEMAGVGSSMNVTTRPLRREVFVVPSADGVDYESDGVMIGDEDTGIYFRPERGNNILIGSTEPACDELEWIEDPDGFRETITDEEHQLLALRCARRIPSLGVPQQKRGVAGLYDVSSDWIPIYDRSDLPGFYLAIGTSGNQFKNAPIAGFCMAELIEAVENGHDHDAEPIVVEGPFTGLPIDMSTFSRNRDVTHASTMSVLG